MHFGKSKVIFDSSAFLLIRFLSVVFIQVLKNIIPLKMSVSTVYIQQVTYKNVLQYHVSEYITQFWGHIIQNLRCQSTWCRETTWLKIYDILLNATEAYSKMRLLKWKAHLWLRCCPCDDYQILWLSVKDNCHNCLTRPCWLLETHCVSLEKIHSSCIAIVLGRNVRNNG